MVKQTMHIQTNVLINKYLHWYQSNIEQYVIHYDIKWQTNNFTMMSNGVN